MGADAPLAPPLTTPLTCIPVSIAGRVTKPRAAKSRAKSKEIIPTSSEDESEADQLLFPISGISEKNSPSKKRKTDKNISEDFPSKLENYLQVKNPQSMKANPSNSEDNTNR